MDKFTYELNFSKEIVIVVLESFIQFRGFNKQMNLQFETWFSVYLLQPPKLDWILWKHLRSWYKLQYLIHRRNESLKALFISQKSIHIWILPIFLPHWNHFNYPSKMSNVKDNLGIKQLFQILLLDEYIYICWYILEHYNINEYTTALLNSILYILT